MTKTRKFGPIGVYPQSVHSKLTGKWFMDIPSSLTSTGKRKRKLYANKTQAEKMAREVNKRMRMRELGFAETKPQNQIPLKQGIAEWKCEQEKLVKTGGLCASSLQTRLHQLDPLSKQLSKRFVSRITTTDLLDYQVQRLGAGMKAATVNSEVAALRQVLSWMAEKYKGCLKSVPKVKRAKGKRRTYDIPSELELAAVIHHLPKHRKTIVRLMAETGMRRGEVFNLPWQHVYLDQGYLAVAPFDDWKPKNEGSERHVWLSPGLRAEMRSLPQSGVFVFSGRDPDKPLTSIQKTLNTAVKKAGLKRGNRLMKVTPAGLRKMFATLQAVENIPPSVLRKQMGHSKGSRMVDEHYINLPDEAVRKAYRELPNHENLALAISGNGQMEGGEAQSL